MTRCGTTFGDLADLEEGALSDTAAAVLREHLASGCDECRSQMSPLQRMLAALRRPALVHAPARALAAASQTFAEQHDKPGITVLVARLVFDSWGGLTPALARGESGATRRQVFSTPWHDVDLWGERLTDELWYLIGQIMPKEGGTAYKPYEALLYSHEKRVLAGVPENGEFHIPSVRAGTYKLRLRLNGTELVLQDVQVGS